MTEIDTGDYRLNALLKAMEAFMNEQTPETRMSLAVAFQSYVHSVAHRDWQPTPQRTYPPGA